MLGVAPYPGALGANSPQPFRPGGAPAYSLGRGQRTLRGDTAADGTTVTTAEHEAIMFSMFGTGAAVAGMAASAAGGALIGGAASAKWSGAGTGALVSGGLAGLSGGLGATWASSAVGESAAPGMLVAASGAGLLGWGVWRWNKLRKGGR